MLSGQGEDMSPVLPSMAKMLAHPDMSVKKVGGEVLTQFSSTNADMVLLAINTLVQDTMDSSPMTRGLALRTLSALQQDSVVEYVEKAVLAGLSDSSAYVRRVAVLACMKLHHISPSSVEEGSIVDKLYGMIRDSDPVVVVNCLAVLDEILKAEGGIVINRTLAHYLFTKLVSFPTWYQIQVLDTLKKYVPATEDEMFDILNVLDGFLVHNSPTVVVMCLKLFQQLLQKMPHLLPEAFKRAKPAIIGHLGSGNIELSYTLIDLISTADEDCVKFFCEDFQSFYCRNRDPLYLKSKKIHFLPRLVTDENETSVLDELALYCKDSSGKISLEAMRAIGNLSVNRPSLLQDCTKKLALLFQSTNPQVLSNVLQVVEDLNINDTLFWEEVVPCVCSHHRMITDDVGKAAMIFLLGEHAQNSTEAFLILEEYISYFTQLVDRDLKIQLLTATTKMFLEHPAESQWMLGELLQMAVMNEEDLEVQSRALFLYHLLKSNIHTAKSILKKTVS